MVDRELDDTDREIIHCLQGDARNVTTAEIGEELGISGSTVANRISQLEESGVIAGYTPIIDYDRSGYHQHHLFVGTINREDREEVVAEIADQRGVVGVTGLLADEENVVVDVVAREPGDVATLADTLSALGVHLDRTDVVTSTVARSFDSFGKRTNSDG